MHKKSPVLTPRLSMVAKLIPRCECFADIGTDHAYLPVYLCMENRCKLAVASDIQEGPLKRAEKTIREYGLEEIILLRLGGGLDTLSRGEADAVCIAGMGGLIIAKILEEGREKLNPDCTIILQPMTAVPELREYLNNNGWFIEGEYLAKEDDKIYNIISVKKGDVKADTLTEAELFIGRELIKTKPLYFAEYLEKRIKKLENMIEGLSVSKSKEAEKKLEKCRQLLTDIKLLKR